jgi:hypothetical protein
LQSRGNRPYSAAAVPSFVSEPAPSVTVIAASVSTRVVSWKEAAGMNKPVDSRPSRGSVPP